MRCFGINSQGFSGFGFLGSPLTGVVQAWLQLGVLVLMLRITQLHARCWDGWDMRAATRDWCPMLKLGAAGTKHPDDATRSPPALSYCAMLRCAVAALLLRCCCCAVAAVLCCCSAAVPCGGVLRALTRHHPYHTFVLFIIAIMSNCVSMPRGRHCGYDGRVVGVGDLLRPRRHARYVQYSTVGSTYCGYRRCTVERDFVAAWCVQRT